MSEANELSVTRLIAAKPDKVWDIMVNRTEEWWCPKPGAPRSTSRTAARWVSAT